MAGIGAAFKGIGKVLSKFKKPKAKYIGTDKRKFDPTDDGGPYVRKQKHNAKKARDEGAVYNKSGHVVGTPSKKPGGRTRESIKKYHGIHKDYRTKKSIGGVARIVGKKAMNYIKKNRKKIGKEISSPEGKKKIQDLTSKFKRGFRKD
tara:strand:+ start:31 stop:474 length:444 start_codon:yes stop_codon:yes gene_type:complete